MANYYGPRDIASPREIWLMKKAEQGLPTKKEPTKIPNKIQLVLRAMYWGVDRELFPDSERPIPPGTPLSERQALFATGIRQGTLDWWKNKRIYKDVQRAERDARFMAEDPNNLRVAIEIRDHPGDLPEDRRLKLSAIDRLRVKDPAPAVNIDLSHNTEVNDNRQQVLTAPAGYVVNLSEPKTVEQGAVIKSDQK